MAPWGHPQGGLCRNKAGVCGSGAYPLALLKVFLSPLGLTTGLPAGEGSCYILPSSHTCPRRPPSHGQLHFLQSTGSTARQVVGPFLKPPFDCPRTCRVSLGNAFPRNTTNLEVQDRQVWGPSCCLFSITLVVPCHLLRKTAGLQGDPHSPQGHCLQRMDSLAGFEPHFVGSHTFLPGYPP